MLAQALIATNDPRRCRRSDQLLRVALRDEPECPDAYAQLAMAYGRKGDLADADLASAQAALRARRHQDRAPARDARQDPLPDRLARLGQADDIVDLQAATRSAVQDNCQ